MKAKGGKISKPRFTHEIIGLKTHERERRRENDKISSCASAQREVLKLQPYTKLKFAVSYFIFSFNLISSITLRRNEQKEEEEFAKMRKNCSFEIDDVFEMNTRMDSEKRDQQCD